MRKFIFSTILAFAVAGGVVSCSSGNEESDSVPTPITGHPEPSNCYSDPLGYREQSIKPGNRAATAIIKGGPRDAERIRINDIGYLAEVFNDSNKYQYAWAEKLGIDPIVNLSDAFRTRRPLRLVKSCDAYFVEELTHSYPYLVPEAEDLLRRIGYNFIDSLASRGADGYRIKVTSLLRSPATVKELRKSNVNAVDSSTHQFGTTFDISYAHFVCADPSRTINSEDLKNLLGEVLLDLRKQGRCMVKYEKKSPCFHITVTRPEKN